MNGWLMTQLWWKAGLKFVNLELLPADFDFMAVASAERFGKRDGQPVGMSEVAGSASANVGPVI